MPFAKLNDMILNEKTVSCKYSKYFVFSIIFKYVLNMSKKLNGRSWNIEKKLNKNAIKIYEYIINAL